MNKQPIEDTQSAGELADPANVRSQPVSGDSTRPPPPWFRTGIVQQHYFSPATWQGWLVAAVALGGIVGSLALAIHLAPVAPKLALWIPPLGIGASIIGYMIALKFRGDD